MESNHPFPSSIFQGLGKLLNFKLVGISPHFLVKQQKCWKIYPMGFLNPLLDLIGKSPTKG